jgi:solute carrier family 25 (adenine nucleotide translocator) protein 4/5/6/31
MGKDANLLVDFAAGGTSGAISKTITAPIERVKLIIQTQDSNPLIRSGEVPRYTGIGNCFTRVYAEQGLGAFWRGNFTNCLRYFPTQAFNLAFKDSIKSSFPKYSPKTEFWAFFGVNLASGGLAGAGSLCVVYPLDYARTRLASDVGSGKKTFSGLGDCIMKTAKGPQGVLSLYNGFGVSVAGIIPYRGTQFGLNDTLKGLNPYDKEVSFIGIASKWACAQFSVIASGFVTYPFDTVRRRLQMQSEKPVEERLYKGAVHCLSTIVKEEGVPALFKGAGANILRGTGAALVLVLYGEMKAALYK